MSEETEEVKPVKKTAAKRGPKPKTSAPQEILDASPATIDDPVALIVQDKVMVRMVEGNNYSVGETHFSKEQPFQLMNGADAERLISTTYGRFARATKEEVEKFYSL